MMESRIAEQAKAAYRAEVDAKALEKEAAEIRALDEAARRIAAEAAKFGVEIVAVSRSNNFSRQYEALVPLTPDAGLYFTYRGGDESASARVLPCDQLYWDLGPGVESKPPGGGTYGCYSLSTDALKVKTLPDLGAALLRVEEARERWQRKHGTRR